jgi:membrane associated rhomboid family serine protease
MFPLRDPVVPLTQAPVIRGLFVIHILVFLAVWPLNTDAEVAEIFARYGMTPARLATGEGWLTLLSAPFLHAGWLHLALNLMCLASFGPRVEAMLGPWRFSALYLGAAVAGGLVQLLAAPGAVAPVVGDSGAVAGVMGAFLLLAPRARIEVLAYGVVAARVVAVPAWAILLIWVGLQLLGALSYGADAVQVAFWAHLGGFSAGALLIWPFRRSRGGRHLWRRSLSARQPARGGAPMAHFRRF